MIGTLTAEEVRQLAGRNMAPVMVSSFDAAFLAAFRTTLPTLPRAGRREPSR